MRFLVVEDNIVIGADLVATLEEWGFETSGPHADAAEALNALQQFQPDFAILDYFLRAGEKSDSVALALNSLGTPFICLSGADAGSVKTHEAFNSAVLLEKPVDIDTLHQAVRRLLREAGRS